MKKTIMILVALFVVTTAAASAADFQLGTFTPQGASVSANRIPVVELGFGIDQTDFSKTTLALSFAYAADLFNQNEYFIRSGAEIDKVFSIGDPGRKLSPYVGVGAGLFYVNGNDETDIDFGTSIIGGIRLGSSFFIETKYTDIRNTEIGDGFSVAFGAAY